MISLFQILEMYGIDPNEVGLVRHGDKEIPIHETFKDNLPKLEAYQGFQQKGKFRGAKYIAVFAPYHKTTALFLGLWDVHDCSELTDESRAEIDRYGLPESWKSDGTHRYDLKRNHILDDFSERLVIEWGKGVRAWYQRGQDKEVVEIKGKHSIGDFESFDQVDLNFAELEMMIHSPETNITWVKALSSVNGIYLIKDVSSGKLYVGAAYGERGIYGRWCAYAINGHGGNKGLQALEPMNFRFSVLEIIPPTMTADGVIEREQRWMERLGTREFGLNKN